MNRIGVIGAGAWGTALAQTLARAGHETRLWAREPEVIASVQSHHRNDLYLPGINLDPALTVSNDPAWLEDCSVWLAVAPAQHMRATMERFAAHHRPGVPIILCAKGVEQGSLALMSEVLQQTIPQAIQAVLSGPSFAAEVAKGLPTAVTLACTDAKLGQDLVQMLATPSFRPYLSNDLIGAEAGGAIKNVLAIACGIVEGLGLGRNAHAALITRGFAEMSRVAVALGGQASTVAGLCGLGDLVLTCSSLQSRNMSVGMALGQGQSLSEALAGKLSVAEGVASAPAVEALAHRLGVETPISAAVASILSGQTDVTSAVHGLLSRPLKTEF
jgi:glycerol-3-phosphate dehydrogenase (NAD(P)+)